MSRHRNLRKMSYDYGDDGVAARRARGLAVRYLIASARAVAGCVCVRGRGAGSEYYEDFGEDDGGAFRSAPPPRVAPLRAC